MRCVDRRTNALPHRQTDQPTDTASYRGALSHLKRKEMKRTKKKKKDFTQRKNYSSLSLRDFRMWQHQTYNYVTAIHIHTTVAFLVADTQLYKRLCPSVRWSVGWSVVIELESVKTCISAPAHPFATGIGRVSGLVFLTFNRMNKCFN